MNRNYIIFFWILCLILFTFYCVFRLKYLSDNTRRNTNTNTNTNTNIQEKLVDITLPANITLPAPEITAYTGDDIVTRPALTTKPMVTQVNNFITYIENIQAKDKISDMLNCDTLYDDNLKVRELGYKNCGEAYADYLDKNYDTNKKYSNLYTLAEICPIASKTPEYNKCLNALLTKFSDGVHLVDSVNTDMTHSINKRLNVRTDELYKIQTSINPFLLSKVQTNFNTALMKTGQVGKTADDKLNLINAYYQDKYQGGIETFTNVTLPDIEKLFFGKYKPVRGQFVNLADLIFTIEYDTSDSSDSLNIIQPVATKVEQTKDTTSSDLSPLSVEENVRPIIFTFKNNYIYVVYSVSRLDIIGKTAIKLLLNDKNIIYQSSPTYIVEPLLKHLGLYLPTTINLIFDPYTSTEKRKHDTYRLVNDNLDTILVLEKLPTQKMTKSK